MKKNLMMSTILILVLLLGGVLLSGCAQEAPTSEEPAAEEPATEEPAEETPEAPKEVALGYVNWAEGVAMTFLAEAILEDHMGYEVESTMADVAPIFTSIANGGTDAFMDGWLPVTHESYMENFGDDLVDLGYNNEGARIGLVVPAYMDIETIEELNDVVDDLEGQIIGIDSGAGIMGATEKAIDEYGLDLELIPGSGPTMTASLDKAIEREEAIVVTGWAPHWKFARYDLKFLEDSKGIFGDVENIHTIARVGLEDEMPEVAQFLKNFYLDGQQLGDLMGAFADAGDADELETARQWMAENEDLVMSWIPEK
ncbi:MAG: glycine/betaine ABC transporter [delta proteobacterium ML8_F1]|nr:MAG: glycine/betaine ABC transporter [delta proteobacterium ML8_F1]